MNSRTDAFIGQASDNDLRIALHFLDSAKVLYHSKEYQDHIVLPAMFLVRQFLELGLKYNIRKLNKISTTTNLINELNNNHKLIDLHASFLEHYKTAKTAEGISGLKDQKYLDKLKELVAEVSVLDCGSQGYRYAKNTDGLEIIAPTEVLNLESIFDRLNDAEALLAHVEDVFDL